MYQIHLTGKGMSGRAVRLEVLTTTQIEAAEIAAARDVTSESLQLEYKNKFEKLCMVQMIKEYTEKVTPEKLPEAKWNKSDPADLDVRGLSTYFNTRDIPVLKTWFRTKHDVTQAEVDEVLGKEVAVVVDD
jgi:hypothetical protein